MSRHPKFTRTASSLRRAGLALFVPFVLATSIANAQDAIRPSLAGEASAEARRQDVDHIPYNLRLGPVRFRVSATMGFEYNDNVNFAEVNKQEDFIFRPQVNINTLWPITQLNTLRLDLGVGYSFYADHSEYDTNAILVSPGSQLAFDIFVGDFRINLHDRFSLEQDPVDEFATPAVGNVADYGRFQNTGGVSVLWDLNKAVATVGYDHYTFIATNDDFSYLDRNAEEFNASLSIAATSTTGVGVEGTYVFNYYDESLLNDSDTYTIGGFVETQLSSLIKLRVAGGYQAISFDNKDIVFGPFPPGFLPNGQTFVTFNDNQDLNDYYVNVLLSHRINASISQSISAGHESQLGVNSNYITLNYVRHTANWNIINKTLLTTELFYEDADESGGIQNLGQGEHLQRYGGALTVGYQLTPHVTLGARYQYTQKQSDVLFRDYQQNRVSFDGTYSF